MKNFNKNEINDFNKEKDNYKEEKDKNIKIE